LERKWSALWKILIRIRIFCAGITEIDEIDAIAIIRRRRDGPHRKKSALATETGEGLLLVLHITDEIGALAGRMNLTATAKTLAIQFGCDHLLDGLNRRIIVQQRRR